MQNLSIEDRLGNIESMLLSQKRVLTFDEGCRFIGISSSYCYKLTSLRLIPHTKPEGKKIFFDREQLETWLLRNPIKTVSQLKTEIKK
jgi:excisionase family DNA binding protein